MLLKLKKYLQVGDTLDSSLDIDELKDKVAIKLGYEDNLAYLESFKNVGSSSCFASLYAANKMGLIIATPNMMKVAMTVSAILFIIGVQINFPH